MRSFAFVLVLAGCGGHGTGDIDDVVGAACTSDRDCADRCYLDVQDYPGGFCSIACQSDRDCPVDTYCIAEDGGVCLFACPAFDCDRLGPGWRCRSRDRAGGGSTSVCFGD